MMKPKWIVAILWVVATLPVDAADAVHGVPEFPQKRVSMTILRAMPATNLLQFVTHRSGLRLDLADEIKTNAVSFKFRFDRADTTHVVGWVLHRAGIHNSVFSPECSQEMKDVTITAGSRPFSDVLTDVCDQAHLRWSLQLGALFIEPKDNKENAQPESGRVRK